MNPNTVVLTDLPGVIPLIAANIKLNTLVNASLKTKLIDCFMPMAYSWGDPIAGIEYFTDADIIIASDVIYSPEAYEPLAYSLHHLLKPRDAVRGDGSTAIHHSKPPLCILAHRHRHPEDFKFFTIMNSDKNIVIVEVFLRSPIYESVFSDVKIFMLTWVE